jgi:hypothetical protein
MPPQRHAAPLDIAMHARTNEILSRMLLHLQRIER